MSKASEHAARLKAMAPPPEFYWKDPESFQEIKATVDSEGKLHIYTCGNTAPSGALAFAEWIKDVFSD